MFIEIFTFFSFLLTLASSLICYHYLRKSLYVNGTTTNSLLLNRESYIPKRFTKIVPLLRVHSNVDQFDKFVDLMVLHIDKKYQQIFKEMDSIYYMFEPEGKPSKVENTSKETLIFLDRLRTLLDKSNFHPISKKELEFGLEQSFQVTFPLYPEWDKVSDNLLQDYNLSHADFEEIEFKDRMWMFVRGIDYTKKSERFIEEKIDKLITSVVRCKLSWKIEKSDLITRDKILIERKPFDSSLKSLFQVSTVEEPTYKEVVIVYRNKNSSQPDHINIKTFLNIPMADIELTYPHAKPGMRPKDVIQLTLSFIIANATMLYQLFGSGDFWSFVISIASFLFVVVRLYVLLIGFPDTYKTLAIELLSSKT